MKPHERSRRRRRPHRTLRTPAAPRPVDGRRPSIVGERPKLDVLRRLYGTLLIDPLGGRRVP